jgi:hypothetical protein
VVAKLDVTEGPGAPRALQRLTRDQLLPYAELAVRRVRRTLAEYWLGIAGGTTAAQKLLQASPRTADRMFAEFPILLLPEFPTAMASLGVTYRARAEQLAIMQAAARNNWKSYRELLRSLVRCSTRQSASRGSTPTLRCAGPRAPPARHRSGLGRARDRVRRACGRQAAHQPERGHRGLLTAALTGTDRSWQMRAPPSRPAGRPA